MVTEIAQTGTPMQRFRVRFRDGAVWTILATTFQRQFQPEDLVKFYNAHDIENQNVFLRAAEVSAIAPDADLEMTPPIVALQQDVKSLTARVDALESNLGEIVTRAVGAAFAQRGM